MATRRAMQRRSCRRSQPTGWKTVWLDHLSYQCVDYKKAAAFYATLMGWKVRSDDGKQAVLDIGENSGGIIIRGGLTAPPPAAITDAGLGVSRPPVQAVFDGFAWGIEPWDADKVKAELEKRGLKPVADQPRRDYQSFRVKDPDGFDLAITNGTKALRRKDAGQREAAGAGAVRADRLEHAVSRSHLVRGARFPPQRGVLSGAARMDDASGQRHAGVGADRRHRRRDHPRQRRARARRTRRRGGAAADDRTPPNGVTAAIGHISFGIENWDTERVRAELIKRDVVYVNKDGQTRAAPGHDRHARELPCARRDGMGSSDRQQDRADAIGDAAVLTARTMPLLFSYGTLQQPQVQMSTFGRLLDGQPDELVGFEQSLLAIDGSRVRGDERAVASRDRDVHRPRRQSRQWNGVRAVRQRARERRRIRAGRLHANRDNARVWKPGVGTPRSARLLDNSAIGADL